VVDLEISPSITTGILDRSEGRGQVGAGLATAPLEVFQRALLDLVASQRAQDANPGAAEGPS
jgi:hypothetical protein